MNVKNKQIKNIIFDFGGVLLDVDANKTIRAFEKIGIKNVKPEDISPNKQCLFEEFERGAISTQVFFDRILIEYSDNPSVSQKDMFEAWTALLLPYKEEIVNMLTRLREQNYKIFLLSNTNYPHRIRFLNNFTRQFGYDLESHFDKCYYSDDLGMRKPEQRMYQHVISDADILPHETLFIDDRKQNVEAAEKCGLMAYHLNLEQGERVTDIF